MSTLKSSAENLTLNADGSGNDIKFQSNAVEKASIDQDGNVVAAGTISSTGDTTITNGDIVFATAGKGICLGVTTNTDANTLDDYEEGTWTPVLGDSAGSNVWSGGAGGKYVKVGRAVMCTFHKYTSGSNSDTSAAYITGMPFVSDGVYNFFLANRGSGANGKDFSSLYLADNVSRLALNDYSRSTGGASGEAAIELNDVITDGTVTSTFWYYTD